MEKIELKIEKSKIQLLEEFKSSLDKFGVQGAECKIENGELTIKQILGAGIRGLGYDKDAKSLWMCLDQADSKSIQENQKWNANTILDISKEFPGLTLEKIEKDKVKIIISSDHPVARLAALLGTEKKLFLPGEYNDWKFDAPLDIDSKTGDFKTEIEWDGEECQCKVAFTDVVCDWEAGKWMDRASQALRVEL